MMTEVFDLSSIQQEFADIQGGVPLDELKSEAHIRFLAKFSEVFDNVALCELIHVYMTLSRQNEKGE